MAATDTQALSPSLVDQDLASELNGATLRVESPHGDYEARDDTYAEAETSSQQAALADQADAGQTNAESDTLPGDTADTSPQGTELPSAEPAAPATGSTKAVPVKRSITTTTATTKAKGGMSANNAAIGKTAGTSPVAKKSSTTTARATSTASESAKGPGATSATASPLKKSTSGTAMSRPNPTSARAPASDAAKPATPTRRTSIAPAAKVPASTSRASLPASASGSASSLKSASGAARPRAPVSEAAVKKPAATSRPSLSSTAKPTTTSGPASRTHVRSNTLSSPLGKTAAARPSSITSLKDIKEDGGKAEDIQNQLSAANDELKSKNEVVAGLEGQLESLKLALNAAQAETENKNSQAAALETSKATLESALQEAKTAFAKLEADYEELKSALESSKEELEAAKSIALSSGENVTKLNEQIRVLEAEVTAARESLEAVKASHDASSSDAVAAAAVDREALLKARADLEAIAKESEQLKEAQGSALREAQEKIAALDVKAQESESLAAQVDVLKAEKEEMATKISELEIEVLEVKESQESLEDERDRSKEGIAALERKLAGAEEEITKAAEQQKALEKKHSEYVEEIRGEHARELTAAADKHSEIVTTLQATQGSLEAANVELENARKAAADAEEAHQAKLQEVEEAYTIVQNQLTEKIVTLTAELEGQEAQYDAKVQAVKDEHAKLLQEAFERAKHEAGEEHSKELQAFRAESKATMEQIQAANQVALTELQAEHASSLESEVQALGKQLNNAKLDLKATQDDLAKSKAALDASREETETLAKQLEELRSAAEAAPTIAPEHAAEITRLTQELSSTKDDLKAMTEMLNLTKSSMTEMSDHHLKDLEDAAKARTEEVSKLKVEHEQEVLALAKEKGEFAIRLSDLEGELATTKAELESMKALPKPNGNGHAASNAASSAVTEETLRQLHEAHNLKIGDLEAGHEKAMKAMKEEWEAAQDKIGELTQDLSRKAMEIQYLEQEQEETQETVTRLTEDNQLLSDKLAAAGQA